VEDQVHPRRVRPHLTTPVMRPDECRLHRPGGFRTQWAGESYVLLPPLLSRVLRIPTFRMVFGSSKHPAYDHLNAQAAMAARNGKQIGDPVKGARAMYELAIMEDPPLRVVIGSDAYTRIMNK
jgi:hypothetical protein